MCVTRECDRCDTVICCEPCPIRMAAERLRAEREARQKEQAERRDAQDRRAREARERAQIEPNGPKVELGIAAYAPKLSDLHDRSVAARLGALATAVGEARGRGCDVFVAPEYFFNETADAVVASSLEEVGRILTALCTMSRDAPDMLIVPGTLVWANTRGDCRNTAVAYRGGLIQCICHKAGIGYEREHVTLRNGRGFLAGATGYAMTSIRDVPCVLEICRDSGTAASLGIFPPVRLVVASKLGVDGGRGGAVRGGCVVHVDGDGYAQISSSNRTELHEERLTLVRVSVPQRGVSPG